MSGLPPSPLTEIFGSGSSAELIVFLVYNHDREFSAQEIADRLGMSKAKVSRLKEGLLKHGVIRETRKANKVSYYRYDRSTRFGKMFYDLVFTAHAPAAQAPPAAPAPAPKPKARDEGGKIIIA